MKFVITGGPGSGKTSVIDELARRGFDVIPEAARMLIASEEESGGDCLPWINPVGFHEKVAQLQLALEVRYVHDNIPVFLDRGLIDGHGYCILEGIETPEIVRRVGFRRYDAVFLLEQFNEYEDDHVRKESKWRAAEISSSIKGAYMEFGYAVTNVPIIQGQKNYSVARRADYILKNIQI